MATPEAQLQPTDSIPIGGKRSGAWLVRYALEQLPVSHTFGIPGVHNTELYDELNSSERIHPVLVTHECGAAFMADAISRTSQGEIGVLAIVPAAGITHAMSGIGEAYLDGIPMLIISGGTRTDVPFGYQIHELDQQALLANVCKRSWRLSAHTDIVPTLFEAYRTAMSGVPGPVFVEVPVNLQLFREHIASVPVFVPPTLPELAPGIEQQLDAAAAMLAVADKPGLFVGWGAVDVAEDIRAVAEHLGAPVSTTLQGLSAFPGDHPLHTGMGFGPAAVPAAHNAFKDCDCMLAVGTRFAEIPTGSFGCRVPEALIHIDIDPAVPGRNYPAQVPLIGDARVLVPMLRQRIHRATEPHVERRKAVSGSIAVDKRDYRDEWHKHRSPRVNPLRFFEALRKQLAVDAIVTTDDGNHTFLTAELMPILRSRSFISPTDFNCMGYCVPATIGAKLANRERQVVGIAGDGAFLMTGMELLPATVEQAGVVIFVLHDGELSQISQGQEIPYNRKTCTQLGEIRLAGIAQATGARYISIDNNDDLDEGIRLALKAADGGQSAVVDVAIDYSKRTRFTKGVVGTVLKRFPLGDKFRFIGRAVTRRVTG
ncbi:thiamine pyrophosphate-binding protein [Algiphilus aromaticivorans]|uniref:thiamine pyrophosphate-binding protein n=1 Tax=Algiphilus aromaticivorans TaxID=382454 RepID=UPI0006947F08|nr:thiamine pyrophosphate-binding protein [Algiphilus aromaticivorans]